MNNRQKAQQQFDRFVAAAEAVGITPPEGYKWQLRIGSQFHSYAVYWSDGVHEKRTPIGDAWSNIGYTAPEASAMLASSAQLLEEVKRRETV